ncbi:MAG TPA: hypothetical protein VI756_03880, partial [Blastocatellia bacterium]
LTRLDPLQVGSLALICPDTFSFRFQMNIAGDDVAVRAGFRIRNKTFSDVGCTDLRMRALGRLLMAGSQDTIDLTEDDFKRRDKETVYLAIGLSRLYMDKYWPIVVGVHSVPELDVEIDYARL